MATNVILNGTPTEDTALTYALDPPGGTATSQVWESSTDGTTWTPIPGATNATFTPGDAEAGKSLRVVVQVDETGVVSTATSDPAVVANVNDVPEGTFTIAGTAKQGETLTSTDLVSDADGIAADARSYKWQVQGADNAWTDIDGATGGTFVLSQGQVGRAVRGVVSYTDDRGTSETVESAATLAVEDTNVAPSGTLTVAGTVKQGETISLIDLVNDDDGIANDGRFYKLQVQGEGGVWTDIEGANPDAFVLTQAEVGRAVRGVVSYTDNDGKAETFEGAATAPVGSADATNTAPTGTPVLDDGPGDAPLEGAPVTVDVSGVADADGLGAFAYVWSREGAQPDTWTAIASADKASYTPDDADVGGRLRVEASYTDGKGTKESFTLTTAADVGNVNDAPTGAVTLAGGAVRGQTITASTDTLADADGIGPISLQWERATGNGGWTAIDGATAAAYTPVEADVGLVLRAVASWTDKQGTDERVVAETAAVAASRPITLPPPEDGETRENSAKDELTSTDFAKLLAEGGTFTPPAGVERVELADGVLSFGTGTTEAFVARLYLGLLGREGDVEGLAFVSDAARDGASKAVLAGVFLSSAEYKALQGAQTNAEFVEDLYGAFLGRSGDAAERGFWTAALDGGASRAEVAAGLAGSAEAASHLQASTTGVFVADLEGISARSLYNCSLGREADASGLLHWSNLLEQGVDLRTLGGGFEKSAEFQARHGAATDEAFVERLYQDGTGRQADAAGLDYWSGLLESGRMGRGELALHFSMEQEARNDLDWPL